MFFVLRAEKDMAKTQHRVLNRYSSKFSQNCHYATNKRQAS